MVTVSSRFFSFLGLSTLLSCAYFSTKAHAHIHNNWPPAYRSKYNPLIAEANIDYDSSGPISQGGPAAFPCKGQLLKDQPVAAVLTTGKEHNITFLDGAPHNHGSCQVSLSYDEKSYFVIHSWIGGCPTVNSAFKFTVPQDAPLGKASFLWTWINKGGAREYYGTCSSVMIEAGTSGPAPAIPFHDRPDVFVAHLGNCPEIPHGTDVKFEYPGPDADVTVASQDAKVITGCKPVNGIGNTVRTAGSVKPAPAPEPAPEPVPEISSRSLTAAPVTSSTASVFIPDFTKSLPLPSTTPAHNGSACHPAPTQSLEISKDMRCGPSEGKKCPVGLCCSSKGWCGNTPDYCAVQLCQKGFGQCSVIPGLFTTLHTTITRGQGRRHIVTAA